MHRPERNVGEDDDGRAVRFAGQVLPQPIKLLLAQKSEASSPQVHAVVEADEMHSVVIEAAPAIADDAPAVALEICAAIILGDIVLSGHAEDFACAQGAVKLIHRVELL